jgi:hypothetical protein
MALPKVQATTIVSPTYVTSREASSRLGVLADCLPISLHNLLGAICERFRS